MVLVEAIRESDWTKDDGTVVKVTNVAFNDGTEAPGYDLPPGVEVHKPLPQGWEVATAKSGKPYIKTPKQGRQMPTAFRNTKEGQAYEQERMDRRTALMQAVATGDMAATVNILHLAGEFYTWLRQTSGAEGLGMGSSAPGTKSEEGNRLGKGAPSSDSTSPAPLAGTKAGSDGGTTPTVRPQAVPTGQNPEPAAGAEPTGPAYGPTCDHPLEQQYEATSGRIKCRICKGFVD